MRKLLITIFGIITLLIANEGCRKDICLICIPDVDTSANFQTTPYDFQSPPGFPTPVFADNNPLTIEGVALGRKLFYDETWSNGGSTSCNTCHKQELSFSLGASCQATINGTILPRDIMPLVNLAWKNSFAWDGRSRSLEEKIISTITNPLSMATTDSIIKLNIANDVIYQELYSKAFGSADSISLNTTAKALSQFIQIFISNNSRYDEFKASELEAIQFFTPAEFEGYIIFNTETGDCFHCHGTDLITDDDWHNNGMDETFTDLGLGATSGNSSDNGKFKSNTLRNIEFTAPYMHDGRFSTLEEVVEFYSFGVQATSPNIDPLMKKAQQGGIQLSASERASLVAYLKTFSDNTFLSNPEYSAQ